MEWPRLTASGGGLDTQSEPSPDVLRSLHSDYLHQLRASALGWSAVVAAGFAIAILTGRWVGPLVLALLIAGVQAAKVGYEWWRERRVDPIAAESAGAREAQQLERDRVAAFKERLRGTRLIATGTLAGIVVLVTVIEWFTAGTIWITIGRAGLIKPLVSQGEWWRLVTSTFVHANLMHLAANILALLAFGRILETLVPRAWVIVTYLTAGIAGSLAS